MNRREFLKQQFRKVAPVFIAGICLLAVLLLVRISDLSVSNTYVNFSMVVRLLAIFAGAVLLLVLLLYILSQLTERLLRLFPAAISLFIRRYGSEIVSAIILVVACYQIYLHREKFNFSYFIVPGILLLKLIIDFFRKRPDTAK